MADSISIAITLNDEISGALKSIASTTQGCSKAMEELAKKSQNLSARYGDLNKKSAAASAEAMDVKRAMDEAAKSFKKTGDEADKVKFEKLKAQYEDLKLSAKGYGDAAKDTVKDLRALRDEARKMEGQYTGDIFRSAEMGAPDSKNFATKALGTDGLSQLQENKLFRTAIDTFSSSLNAFMGSALGESGTSIVSNIISGATGGASALSFLGPWGTLLGGIGGSALGFVNAKTQIFEARDDAFKSYVQDAHEGQLAEQETSLTAGSTLAAGRETDRISFTQLFGNEQTADDYLSNMVDMANSTPFLYEDLKSMTHGLYGPPRCR